MSVLKSAELIGGRAVHPTASIFPRMSVDEIAVLAEDIRNNGQHVPIMVAYADESCSETVLIDGRNRSLACELLGIEPVEELFSAEYTDDLSGWIVSHNLHRRHMSTSQRAMVGAELRRHLAVEARQRQLSSLKQNQDDTVQANLPERSESPAENESATQAAKLVNVGARSVKDADYVATHDPELAQQVRDGKIAVSAAARRIREAAKPAPTDDEETLRREKPWRFGAGEPDEQQKANWTSDFASLKAYIDVFALGLRGDRRMQLRDYLASVVEKMGEDQ